MFCAGTSHAGQPQPPNDARHLCEALPEFKPNQLRALHSMRISKGSPYGGWLVHPIAAGYRHEPSKPLITQSSKTGGKPNSRLSGNNPRGTATMAARLNLRQQETTRLAIQTSQLINRLQDFALGEKTIEIDSSRLKAIEILLRKALPDLSSISVGGDEDNPLNVVHEIRRTIVRPNPGS